jgi:hypothetical protein
VARRRRTAKGFPAFPISTDRLERSMSVRVKKTHFALKHRGTTTILPGESIAAFDALHRDLISELTPNCVLADNIVATIARLIWRKQNLATFQKAVYVRFNYEQIMRREFSRMQPGQAFPPELRKLPPELQGLLEPTDDKSAEQIDAIRQVDAIRDVVSKELGDAAFALAKIGEKATIDGLMNDLEPQERLNGMIEKSLKRLLLVKGLESISASSPRRLRSGLRVRQERPHVWTAPCVSEPKKVIPLSNTGAMPQLSSFPEKVLPNSRSCTEV